VKEKRHPGTKSPVSGPEQNYHRRGEKSEVRTGTKKCAAAVKKRRDRKQAAYHRTKRTVSPPKRKKKKEKGLPYIPATGTIAEPKAKHSTNVTPAPQGTKKCT